MPSSFLTLSDILQLPLQNFTVGIGNPHVPQAGFGKARIAYLVHLFAQDTWHLHPQLTISYGLGWSFDTPLNYDLRKPSYLAPVLGTANLAPTHRNWKNFSPAAGFAWTPWKDGKTVVRGGAGTVDFVDRHFSHIGGSPQLIDVNHFFSARGPVLHPCTDAERSDPRALCSSGPIYLTTGIGSGNYRGLLVRAEKRFSHGWQLLGSYAYSRSDGNGFGVGFDNDNPLSNYGPLNTDYRHILNGSSLVQLPRRFELGIFTTYVSRPPFSVFVDGLDFNGDGTLGDLLPGTTVNEFNRGLGKADLRRLVDLFNRTYAGKMDSHGALIPLVTLPAHFEFGDPLVTQDLRLGRNFPLGERIHLVLIGEVFNLFNISNLSGRSGNLGSRGFGQPKSRVTQVFGSGGPRAFQLAARISF